MEPAFANASWAADFKGWFRTADGVLIQAFREHGVPLAIRMENGNPFSSPAGLGGLTQFSVWLLTLGI